MRTVFAIAPWEYPGATFDPNAHAFTRHFFAGKERELWLKMRDGVIYFGEGEGEGEGERVYALTHLFDDAIAVDAERLIAIWRSEVERENYGVYLVCRHQWKHLFAIGSFCLILRADNSGWIKEHFDEAWQEFPSLSAKIVQLWGDKPLEKVGVSVVQELQAQFLERTVDTIHFQSVAPHWTGNVDDITKVLRSAAQLWLLPMKSKDNIWNPQTRLHWWFKSNNAFSDVDDINPFSKCPVNSHFSQMEELVKWRTSWVGIEWKQVSKKYDVESKLQADERKRWQRGMNKWGEEWRGNFVFRRHDCGFAERPLSVPTENERLDATFIIRDFLQGKLPAEQIEEMLRDSPSN